MSLTFVRPPPHPSSHLDGVNGQVDLYENIGRSIYLVVLKKLGRYEKNFKILHTC